MTDLKLFGNIYRNVTSLNATDINDNELTYVLEGERRFSADDFVSHNMAGDVVLTGDLIANYGFSWQKITSVTSSSVKTVQDRAFNECKSLRSVSLPECTSINMNYTFFNCNLLSSLYIPKAVVSNTNYTFRYCSQLEVLVMPKINIAISSNFARNCTRLRVIDLGTPTQISSANNMDSTALDTLILRKTDAIVTLGGIANFNNSPFASGKTGGTLYVPQALISQYESATNWSTILGYENNQILPIEGSYYETHYADGTEITND